MALERQYSNPRPNSGNRRNKKNYKNISNGTTLTSPVQPQKLTICVNSAEENDFDNGCIGIKEGGANNGNKDNNKVGVDGSEMGQDDRRLGESEQDGDGGTVTTQEQESVCDVSTVIKEKTPMCLINELARFNKIKHMYTLLDEQGPAHRKTFYVKLRLGDNEDYKAEGQSIKKAQHAAAMMGLQETKYPAPPNKSTGNSVGDKAACSTSTVPPTVELNALAMKLSQTVVYTPINSNDPALTSSPPIRMQYPSYDPASYSYAQPQQMGYNEARLGGFQYRQPMYNRYQQPAFSHPRYRHTAQHCRVLVRVGDKEFMGEGSNMQAARHCAAANALRYFKSSPSSSAQPSEPPNPSTSEVTTTTTITEAEEKSEENEGKNGVNVSIQPSTNTELKNSNKSEISLVHEIALKRNMTINFEVVKESGPPHMRTFITQCTCGDKFSAEGSANNKQLSKRKAAQNMLEQLSLLSPLPNTSNTYSSLAAGQLSEKQKKFPKKYRQAKNKSIDKVERVSAADYGVGINPVSRLAQVQQVKREREPVYELIAEKGLPRAREFVMQVTVGEHVCTASGMNKKIAKRNVAEQMLLLLGYCSYTADSSHQPIKSSPRKVNKDLIGERKVKFSEETEEGEELEAARQLIPGVILRTVDQSSDVCDSEGLTATTTQHDDDDDDDNVIKSTDGVTSKASIILKELLTFAGSSPTLESMMRAEQLLTCESSAIDEPLRPKDKLLYLASLLGFHVQFTDFPKSIFAFNQQAWPRLMQKCSEIKQIQKFTKKLTECFIVLRQIPDSRIERGNKSQYISIATLSTTPPQHSHGSASSIEEANDSAALLALKNLAEFGLDGTGCVTPPSCCGSTNHKHSH